MKNFWMEMLVGLETVAIVSALIVPDIIAQSPAAPFPTHDVTYSCVPGDGTSAPIDVKFTANPSPQFQVIVGAPPASADLINPQIVSITNSAGLDVTSGAVKLLSSNAGLAITVSATDNVGVVNGHLDVDGKLATPFGNGIDALPQPFYVRWNAKSVTAGSHAFRLAVCDIAQNCAERTWIMQK